MLCVVLLIEKSRHCAHVLRGVGLVAPGSVCPGVLATLSGYFCLCFII